MPSIAVIGASMDRAKFGNKCVRAYLKVGYQVYPVNPSGDEIEGLPVARSIADVPPGHLDRVSVYLSPERLLTVLPEIAARDVGELWLNPGTESPAVIARARELGLNAVRGCSIVDVGIDPHDLPD